jgi:hypothetical protein
MKCDKCGKIIEGGHLKLINIKSIHIDIIKPDEPQEIQQLHDSEWT